MSLMAKMTQKADEGGCVGPGQTDNVQRKLTVQSESMFPSHIEFNHQIDRI